ncbi:MAG: glycosyltransferase, partial [Anaerolineae bacterium]|nr:glycosyltransferase [Anaerolineae bacterium]
FSTPAHRIYNGLDLARFAYQSPRQRSRKVVAVGRLVEKKGFADLVDACAILRQRGIEFFCEVIGGGELTETFARRLLDTACRIA